MKTATVTELKKELQHLPHDDLIALCLRLSRFKKENKELLTYLLFEANNEEQFIKHVKEEIDEMFDDINNSSYYFMKKSMRKILKVIKKYVRYSSKKETEVELLLFFCDCMYNFYPSIFENKTLENLYSRQIDYLRKKISLLHEDLQYDYNLELEKLE